MTGCGSGNGASSSDAGSGSDSGSASQPISVVSREDGSGTRGAFVELTGVEEKDADGNKTDNTTADAIISNSTEIMMTTVSGDEYAIGYSSTGSLNDTVKALNVDGVEPTAQNIKDGKYSLSRPFNIATKGTPGKLALAVQKANADGIRMLNEACASKEVIELKSLEAFAKAADGKATKIIIPSEIQGLAGMVSSVTEIAKSSGDK